MRVTNNMMVSQLIYNLKNNNSSMYAMQDQLATGKNIQRASDDPIASSKILKYKTDLSSLDQYSRNTSDALNWLEISESAIYDNVNLLQRARELAVQAANGTNTTEDTQKMSEEINGLMKQMISNGNMNYAGRYIFSGFETDSPLFKEDGTYNIDIDQFAIDNKALTKYQIGVGTTIEISNNGLDIYGIVPQINNFTSMLPEDQTIGTKATQSKLVGQFDFTDDYTGDNLDITLGANTYVVDMTSFDGTSKSLTKSFVLDRLNNATDGTNLLKDVADIYYDKDDNLIIKAKAFGANGISTASGIFTPSTTIGTNTVEANIISSAIITDADVIADPNVFKNGELLVTYNGQRAKIKIDPAAIITDVNSYITALNNSLDSAFGAGNVVASGVSGGSISIATANSPQNGVAPTLDVGIIKVKEASLINDFKDFVTALNSGDQAGMESFLSKVDGHMNNILSIQADIGARNNRLELIINRISENSITYTRQLSDAQDADMGEVIMKLKNAENVYKASLDTGARVIQPTLIDFLR